MEAELAQQSLGHQYQAVPFVVEVARRERVVHRENEEGHGGLAKLGSDLAHLIVKLEAAVAAGLKKRPLGRQLPEPVARQAVASLPRVFSRLQGLLP